MKPIDFQMLCVHKKIQKLLNNIFFITKFHWEHVEKIEIMIFLPVFMKRIDKKII